MSSLASSAPISSSVMGGLRRLEVSNPGAIPSPSQAAQKLSESGSSPVPSQRLHRSTIVRKKHWSVRSHPTETRHPSCLYQRQLTALGFRAVRSASDRAPDAQRRPAAVPSSPPPSPLPSAR